jgi:hypothetical protein
MTRGQHLRAARSRDLLFWERQPRLVEALHRLGPRALFRLICELEKYGDLPDLDRQKNSLISKAAP